MGSPSNPAPPYPQVQTYFHVGLIKGTPRWRGIEGLVGGTQKFNGVCRDLRPTGLRRLGFAA